MSYDVNTRPSLLKPPKKSSRFFRVNSATSLSPHLSLLPPKTLLQIPASSSPSFLFENLLPSLTRNAPRPYGAHPRARPQPYIRLPICHTPIPILAATAVAFALRCTPLVLLFGDGGRKQSVQDVYRSGKSAGGETEWKNESGHAEAVEFGESVG